MATRTKTKVATRNPYARYFIYAPIGAGQLLLEKAREIPGKARHIASDPRGKVIRTYEGFVARGEELVTGIRGSAPTHRAMDQAKTARSRVKAAATSVGKAVEATADATRSAAKKVG